MGIATIFEVMVHRPRTLLLLSLAATLAAACPKGSYNSEELHTCVACTVCDADRKLVVLRPCEIHRDAVCVPIAELFAYMNPEGHRRRHGRKRLQEGGDVVWKFGEDAKSVVEDQDGGSGGGGLEVVTEVAFSGAEALVWDWQAIALTLAVFACILFFLVITLYSLHQARQWRRLKENFDADVEELSARLSLMAASSSEKGEILEPSLGPIRDGNYLNNRCVYLEQLLNVRKEHKSGAKVGNVYIQEAANNGAKA